MSEFNKADAAKFIYSLLVENSNEAKAASIAANAALRGAHESNRYSQEEYDKEQNLMPDFGPSRFRLPYSPESLTRLSKESEQKSLSAERWQNARDWFVEDILEKYVK